MLVNTTVAPASPATTSDSVDASPESAPAAPEPEPVPEDPEPVSETRVSRYSCLVGLVTGHAPVVPVPELEPAVPSPDDDDDDESELAVLDDGLVPDVPELESEPDEPDSRSARL